MKNTFLLFCLLFLPFTLSSQIHTSVDIIGSYGLINSSNGVAFFTSDSRFNFRIGGNFNFRIYNRTYVKTGIRYVRQGVEVVTPSNPGPNFRNYIDEYYIEIPFIYRYEFSDKKFSLFSEVGISPHFYLKGTFTKNTGTVTTVEDFDQPYLENKRLRMTIVFGLGFSYKFSKKYQFFVEPIYRYFFPIAVGPFQSVKTRNLGIEFGVRRAISFVNERG